MTFRILSEANVDFAECLQYYLDEETPSTAERFAEIVDLCYTEILENPMRFAPDARGLRRKPIRGFPEHSIGYRIEEEEGVEIVAIRHHKRKPGFWEKRL